MRVAVETHGCRLNQAESDAIAEQLRARGHELVDAIEQADLYLLNSCAITHEADADARAALRRARRRNPEAQVVVTGCHANAEPEQLAAMAEVDAVIGNLEKQHDLGPVLERLRSGGQRPGGSAGGAGALVAVSRLNRRSRPEPWTLAPAAGRTRPLLKIQDGCDYQCSFCIVPQLRGRSRSLAAEVLIEQLRGLDRAGHPEVVLTGVHLGLWGRDLPGTGQGSEPPRLSDLLAALRAAVPTARLRLGSVDPREVDDELIALLGAGLDEQGAGLCRHVHLPIQSGDDEVLRAMRRAHRVADLEQLLPRLRAAAPAIAVGTDVIVGFPGESAQAFDRTRALFESLQIPLAHVFCWSPRSGTAAIELGDRVAPAVAAARSRALREVVADNWRRHLASLLGREQSAVILRRRARGSGDRIALTEGYAKVHLVGSDAGLGRRARVRLEGIVSGQLRGTLVD